jgi:uncharacterized phiE125 gp8 family phage protein
MKYSITTPPANPLWTAQELAYHLRLDDDLSADPNEQAYVAELLAAATEYAQNRMACSLLTQTITAYFYNNDNDVLRLPRGPLVAITSVVDGHEQTITNYTVSAAGVTDIITIPNGWAEPLTVVYTAGYGATATQCPGDIRQAIRLHVGTMYENRESITDKKSAQIVPHSVEDFYDRKTRTSLVG